MGDSFSKTGWHLPKGGSSSHASDSDLWLLGLSIMGTAPSNNERYQSNETNAAGKNAVAAIKSFPNNFIASGFVAGSNLIGARGVSGNYWSSTVYSSYNAYSIYFNSSSVYPGTDNSQKSYGRTVRCIASGA